MTTSPTLSRTLDKTTPVHTHRQSVTLAVDLGTARTQICAPGDGVLLDEPTLIAYDAHGSIVAAGRHAWEVSTETSARLRFPIRRGLAVDPIDCVWFLQLLLRRAGVRVGGPVALAIPAAASAYEAKVLVAVLSSVTGVRVDPVDSLFAAAVGAGMAVDAYDEPSIVCDVGAGVFEIGLVGDRRLRRRASASIGTRDYLDDPQRLLGPARWALQRVLDDVPGVVATDLATRPVRLVGGGALIPGLADDLSAALQTAVVVQDEPRSAVIGGLARCVDPLATRVGQKWS